MRKLDITLKTKHLFRVLLLLKIFLVINQNHVNAQFSSERGSPGSCNSLVEYISSRNYSDFTDLENYPLSNYRIKYGEKGKHLGGRHWKTRGWVSCKRVPKYALEVDRMAYIHGYKNLIKHDRRGRFMCINGKWNHRWRDKTGKWGIMVCPDFRVKEQWKDAYLPQIEAGNDVGNVTVTENWEVSFGIYLFEVTPQEWTNVIHISDNGSLQRHPAMFFFDNFETLHLRSTNTCHNMTHWDNAAQHKKKVDVGWQPGEFHEVRWTSVRDKNELQMSNMSLFIDGRLVVEWSWENLCYGMESTVYISDPWRVPANVSVVGFKYQPLVN